MTFKTDDRVFETSVTSGTGTYTLNGAQVGFTTFAGMGANNDCPYFATDDTNWEVGVGTVLTGPNRLQRTTILRSSNANAAVNWSGGTVKIRCGLPAAMAIPRLLSKSVAGGVDVALTTDEQRRKILILTGALTGNINVTVDATPWEWIVYNNTSGAFTLTLKTTGGTGVAVAQGGRTSLECDGTNVVSSVTALATLGLNGLLDLSAAGAGQIKFPANQNPSADANTLDDYEEGSFTGTLTGLTGTVTATITYTKIGNLVVLKMPASGMSGTSNTTAKTITGMPAALWPATTTGDEFVMVQDNSAAFAVGRAIVGASGVIALYPAVSVNNWTAAGTMSVRFNSISYLLP